MNGIRANANFIDKVVITLKPPPGLFDSTIVWSQVVKGILSGVNGHSRGIPVTNSGNPTRSPIKRGLPLFSSRSLPDPLVNDDRGECDRHQVIT